MKSLLPFIALAALALPPVSFAAGEPLKAVRTVVAGEIVNRGEDDPKIFRVRMDDPFVDRFSIRHDYKKGNVEFFNFRETGGKFRSENDFIFGQNLKLYYKDKYVIYYVEPGDSIFIRIDAAKMDEGGSTDWVAFSGDRAEVSRQINELSHYFEENNLIPQVEVERDMETLRVLAEVRKKIGQVNETVDRYAEQNGTAEFVREWAKAAYKYSIVGNAEMNNNTIWERDNAMKFYTDPIFDITNPINFQFDDFAQFIAGGITGVFFKSEIIDKTESGDTISEADKKKWGGLFHIANPVVKAVREKYDDPLADYIVYRFLMSFTTSKKYDSVVKPGHVFREPAFVEKFRLAEYPRDRNTEFFKLSGVLYYKKKGKTQEIPRANMMSYLADRYKDKVMHITLWSAVRDSNTVAAREELLDMSEKFKDKEVVFVNICVDPQPEEWVRAIDEFPLPGEHYYFDENGKDVFRLDHNIRGYPAFILTDRKGKAILHAVGRIPRTFGYNFDKSIEMLLRGEKIILIR